MQPNSKISIKRVACKEVTLFFASPIAYLFLGSFAAITLFIFFWGEAFFARNIADVRPLFEWMPVLLIFLSATLTMRLWSEERRTGTLEYVHTQAVPLWHFVVGKFIGCLFLLCLALAITLPLPLTVTLIGDLDWGPVIAGYLATLLVGAAYLSIGLFISARSENQIVSLISATALCGAFYLVGNSSITDFFGAQAAEGMRLLGTGSRFESITRGVIDLRDFYYYFSIILVFLALNTLVLEKERWAKSRGRAQHRHWRWLTFFLVANALGANLWLGQINVLRIDVTEGKQYSISSATKNYLNQLQEPLLIRGYFSQKTHPLLAPLVPQMRDLMREYEITGRGKVRVEFIDPLANPELEKEANQKYGIQPVPFQIADRYQSSIVSSYFNVLVEYGDENLVLDFRELIEIQQRSEAEIDVQLRNPEHDLTRAIKKVLRSYQAGGNLFDTVKGNLDFTLYASVDEALPEQLTTFKAIVLQVLDKAQEDSQGRLALKIVDPDADNGRIGQQIAEEFGFRPMATNLLSDDSFYFYMTLSNEEQVIQIPLGDVSEGTFERNLEAAIKRFASGFTKTVALVEPKSSPSASPYAPPSGPSFTQLQSFLSQELDVQLEDLSDGRVSGEADILLLVAPKELNEVELFAVDQFLMQGGTVVAATSPFSASFANRRLDLSEYNSGLQAWLSHHGISQEKSLVLDPQNAAFPVPVTRNIGGLQLQEMRMLDYPFFIDARGKGLNQDNAITSDLPQLTMSWASPILLDETKQGERQVTTLIRSSDESWLTLNQDIMPRVTADGVSAFSIEGNQESHILSVVSAGRFDSFFAGKQSPLLTEAAEGSETEQIEENISSVIERSPDSARIILYSSNDFLNDQVIQLAASAQRSEYLNSFQLMANTIDWSLEDTGLLSIRSRGHFNRTLPPMEQDTQMFWEYLNYGLAALALIFIAGFERRSRRIKQKQYLALFAQ